MSLIEVGQSWEFVGNDGSVRSYVIEMAEADLNLAPVCSLRNVETGKLAWATKHWMREGDKQNGRGFWRKAAEMQQVA